MRMIPQVSAILAAALLPAAPALASDIPRYDVPGHCREVANFGGGGSNMIYNSCVEMEQQAYDGLKHRWSSIPAGTRSHCDEVARFGGAGSYSILESCVQMEQEAAGNSPTFTW